MLKKRLDELCKRDKSTFFVISFAAAAFIAALFFEKQISLYMITAILFFGVLLFRGFLETQKNAAHHLYGILQHYDAVIACFSGAIIAYALSIYANLGPVLGASIAGILAYGVSSFFRHSKDLAPAAYCGAFAGMSSSFVLPNIFLAGAAGIIAGMLYYFAHDTYTGVGGKLGTIAFIGVSIIVIVIRIAGGMI